ncbi:EAL domain-containing protein [Liberiplasma polymorphum]|uniref:EAL domain-containing protein n=1 Tax=Liberiplasma polymorphum TaxID=3374570 RepID=UPI003775ED17
MDKGLQLIRPVIVVMMLGLIILLWVSQGYESVSNVYYVVVFGGFLSVVGLFAINYINEIKLSPLQQELHYVVKGQEKLQVNLKELIVGNVYNNQPLVMGYKYMQFSLNPNTHKNFSHGYETISYENEKSNQMELLINFDKNGNIKFVSDSTLDLFDLTLKDVIGKNVLEFSSYFGINLANLKNLQESYRAHSAVEVSVEDSKKRIFWTYEAIINNHNDIALIIAQGHEITQYFKQSYDENYHLHRDYLTGLYNQQGLYEAIRNLQNVDRAVAFFIDIKSFSKINDLFGHHVGDEVLISIARALEEIVGSEALISRFSGDEFVVFCTNASASDDQINHYLKSFKTPLSSFLENEELPVQIEKSMGYALYPDDTTDLEKLISLASLATNNNKTNGSDIKRYNSHIKETLKKKYTLTNKLRKAIENEVIEIYFQEVIETNSQKVKYVEELARWKDASLGFVAPEVFFDLAREANIIDLLDRYLVEKTFESFNNLILKDRYKDVILSLNLAPESLLDLNFLYYLNDMAKRFKIDSSRISIEVSETTFINNLELCIDRIKLYKENGFMIALDDFGREYSALSVLENVPYDVIKIDAVFTANIHNLQSREIVRMIRNISLISNKEMIAEGVETPEQSDALKSLGCTLHQGYLYHHPSKG